MDYVAGYFLLSRPSAFMGAGYVQQFPSMWLMRIDSPVGKIESCFRGKPVWLITPNKGPGLTTQIPVVR